MGLAQLFKTTNKGILLMENMKQSTILNRRIFGFSLGLQIIFMLFFIALFGLAIFRSVKKIKNPKFKTEKEQDQSEDEDNFEDDTNAKQTNDNLIYRFDEEDHEKQKKLEQEEEQEQKQNLGEDESDDEYQREHDEHQQRYLEIDHQLLFLQPFLISHLIANSIFSADMLSISMFLATVFIFFIFNIRGACSTQKWTSLLFFVPAIIGFLPIFYGDHDMST